MQVCTSLLTDNHASTPSLCFFTGWIPFLPPKQQTQITEGNVACWLEFYCFADGYYFDGDVFVGYSGCRCLDTLSSALGSFENMVVFYALIICYFRIFPSSCITCCFLTNPSHIQYFPCGPYSLGSTVFGFGCHLLVFLLVVIVLQMKSAFWCTSATASGL